MNYSLLLAAVMSVESANGELSGDNGKAQGRMMCHAIMVREVNRLTGSKHKTSAAYRRKYSEAIFLDFAKYMHTWEGYNVRQIAQCWNAGADALAKRQAIGYASKVESMYWSYMQTENNARITWLMSKGAK